MSDIDSRYFVTYPSRTNTTIALTLIFVTVVVIIFIVVIVLLLRKSTSSSTCTAAPSPPTGVTAVYVSPTQFNVTWAPVQAAISYTIYIGTINGFSPGQAILTKSATVPPAAITNLKTNVTYYILIVSINSCGTSATSEQITFQFVNPS
jgi:hypothetical protein